MTNELLQVEVSCAIFTHIITVIVATVTAVQREEGRGGVLVMGHSTIHTSSRNGGRERGRAMSRNLLKEAARQMDF